MKLNLGTEVLFNGGRLGFVDAICDDGHYFIREDDESPFGQWVHWTRIVVLS